PASGEINSVLSDAKSAIERVRLNYQSDANIIDNTDGVSIEYDDWRFNLRSSNTEPVVRLNVESRNDIDLMLNKKEEILRLLRG
ncbi:phosphomannomutase CpsG, partial [Escherichia coli]